MNPRGTDALIWLACCVLLVALVAVAVAGGGS